MCSALEKAVQAVLANGSPDQWGSKIRVHIASLPHIPAAAELMQIMLSPYVLSRTWVEIL